MFSKGSYTCIRTTRPSVGVLLIELSRPASRNAVNGVMLQELVVGALLFVSVLSTFLHLSFQNQKVWPMVKTDPEGGFSYGGWGWVSQVRSSPRSFALIPVFNVSPFLRGYTSWQALSWNGRDHLRVKLYSIRFFTHYTHTNMHVKRTHLTCLVSWPGFVSFQTI
jgi:hypothetical protein